MSKKSKKIYYIQKIWKSDHCEIHLNYKKNSHFPWLIELLVNFNIDNSFFSFWCFLKFKVDNTARTFRREILHFNLNENVNVIDRMSARLLKAG